MEEQEKKAWQEDTYEAWLERFGSPSEAAARIQKDPKVKLQPIYKYFGKVEGKKIANLMGSNGIKAVSLALLGAEVTVIDFSPGNAQYARELSTAAGVEIDYLINDVLELPQDRLVPVYDIVFAELGIIHYFTALKPFMNVAFKLLKPGGRFVLRDFHPVSTKLISSKGTTANIRKHKVTGDYFDTTLEEKPAAYTKYLPEGEEPAKVYLRKWTLGEVVTAVAASGLRISVLEEEPNLSSDAFDKGIPKTFTIVADKA